MMVLGLRTKKNFAEGWEETPSLVMAKILATTMGIQPCLLSAENIEVKMKRYLFDEDKQKQKLFSVKQRGGMTLSPSHVSCPQWMAGW